MIFRLPNGIKGWHGGKNSIKKNLYRRRNLEKYINAFIADSFKTAFVGNKIFSSKTVVYLLERRLF